MIISLKPGEIVNFNKREYVIEDFSMNGKNVILKDLITKQPIVVETSELVEKVYKSSAREKSTRKSFFPFEDEKLFEVVRKRKQIIDEVLSNPNYGRKDVEEVAKKYGVNYSTVYRWLKKYKEQGPSGLIPDYHKRGPQSKLPEEVWEIIESEIKTYYLSTQKPKVKDLHLRIVRKCMEAGLKAPHYNTVLRIVNNLNPREVARKREGRRKAQAYKPVLGSLEAKSPFEIIQIDHTKLDIVVVDELYRKPVGRPWITVALDVYSRMVYGFYLSLDAPSFFSVAQTLLMGIEPKNYYLEKWDLADEEWPILGLPRGIVIHTDNAKEFRSKEMQNFLEFYGIHQEFRPKATPHYGGHIERFFKTLNDELHKLPGTTFSNIQQKGEYNPEKHASMTLSELEKYIASWIVKVYHKKPHAGIGTSPLEAFKRAVFGDGKGKGIGYPSLLSREELEKIRISLLYTEKRTVQRYGVRIDHVTYWSEILIPYIGTNRKFIFKVDPRDVSSIYFFHPDHKEYYKIPCKDFTFPPMTRWELREVIKYLKKRGKSEITEFDIISAYKYLESLKEKAQKKTKKARLSLTKKRRYKEEKQREVKNQEKRGSLKSSTSPDELTEIEELEVVIYDD
ncbi:MAG: DDE-type integrase/transposase/recombinase [Thermodesulfobacterium sp.]|nr:DDE-type integrase/transposase/recombinase [Thermodesulfobacterium sp.]